MRVVTDRDGADQLLEGWSEEAGTGGLYKDYPLELAGSDTEVEHEIPIVENGEQEDDWSYTAQG